VLPIVHYYPRPRSILILDNALIYKLARLHDLYEEHGVSLVCLLPYFTDYKPNRGVRLRTLRHVDLKGTVTSRRHLQGFKVFLYFGRQLINRELI